LNLQYVFVAEIFFICFLATLMNVHCQIIGYKSHLTEHAVATKDVVVNIKLFNVGESPVYDIQVSDEWPEDEFERVIGTTDAHFDKISPGANVSHTFVVKPKSTGVFDSVPAKIQFRQTQKGPVEIGYSNDVGHFGVESSSTHARRTSSHLKEWGVFAILSSVCVLPALYVWTKILSEYDNGVKRDKKQN